MKKRSLWHLALVACIGIGACALTGAAPAPAPAVAAAEDPISTTFVLEIRVQLSAPESMGATFDGTRIVFPIVGGTFSGPALKGKVIPGGGDFFVERPDGTGMVDALYRLRTDDGVQIIIHTKGLFIPTPEGRRKEKAGERLTPADQYCRTVPEFIAPTGRYDWLTRSIFVGTIGDGGKNEVIIRIYRVS